MSLLRSLALCIAAILLSLSMGELGLRLAGFPSRAIHSISAEGYAALPGMYESGSLRGLIRIRGLPHAVQINSQGYRGSEPDPGSGVPRVLFVGDSFTFGDHVDDADTLPAQVEAALGGRIEALNGGVAGSTISDQRVFAERLLALEPQLVVLVFTENDLHDLAKPVQLHEDLARNREMRRVGVARLLFHTVRELALFQLLLKARNAWKVELPTDAVPGAAPGGIPQAWVDHYLREALAFRAELAARDLRLVIALYPWPETVAGTEHGSRLELVKSALERGGVEVVDLTPGLRESRLPADELYLLPIDGHPSARGYRIAAQTLAPAVASALAARR